MRHDMAIPSIAGISLFSGVGMLDEGFRAGLEYMGIQYRTICHVEREAYAAAVLVARMQEGSLAPAPVWSDVTTFDGAAWRGKVDCVVAGFPCQDLSVAGKRKGLDGERSGLFFEILRIAADCEARILFLENVSNIASAPATVMDEAEGLLEERAAARVVGELADRGWNAEWLNLSASDVGASHKRSRWFCLAWRELGDAKSFGRRQGRTEMYRQTGRSDPVGTNGSMAYPPSTRRDKRQNSRTGCGDACEDGCRCVQSKRNSSAMANAECSERRQITGAGIHSGQWENSGRQKTGGPGIRNQALADTSGIGRQSLGKANIKHDRSITGTDCEQSFPPGNTDYPRPQGQCDNLEKHPDQRTARPGSPYLFAPGPSSEDWQWIISRFPYLSPALEPNFCLVVDGMAYDMADSRTARIRCAGNGVVPLCAAAATVELFRRSDLMNNSKERKS